MNTLLHITSSLFGSDGASSQLATDYAAHWQQRHPQGRVLRRDLAAHPLPHLDARRFTAFTTAADQRNAEQQQIVDESDALIAELEQADTVLLAIPMYNFGVPSTLKTWMDHVARAGLTFRYTENGPEGLLKNKRAVVMLTRGGHYQDTAADNQAPLIRQFLAFIGITDVELVYAERLAFGPDARTQSMRAARQHSLQLLEHAQAA